MKNIVRFTFVALLVSVFSSQLFAQEKFLSPDLFGLGGDGAAQKSPTVTMLLSPKTAKPGDVVTFSIRVKLPPKSYTYSMKKGLAGSRTSVKIKAISGLTPIDSNFIADRQPESKKEPLFDNQMVEKFHEQVTWKRQYRILPDADLKKVGIVGKLKFQYCDDSQCGIKEEPIELTLLDDGELPSATTSNPASSASTGVPIQTHPFSFKEIPTRGKKKKTDPLSLQFSLSPENAKAGEMVRLTVTMKLNEGWHTYAQTQNPKNVGLPIVFTLKNKYHLQQTDGKFTPNHPPETTYLQPDNIEQKQFHGTVTWTQKFTVTENAKPGEYGVSGQIKYQVCKKVCLRPFPKKFALGVVPVMSSLTSQPLEKPTYVIKNQEGLSNKFELLSPQGVVETEGSLMYYLTIAFIGGLIMNIMPCVLPVLAIKVLSFVKQAGENRGKILALNLSYSAGVLTVFLILAGFVVGVGLGLGEQFQRPEFNLFMASFIFAMGLSLLGVFEIPVLGIVNNAASGEQKEGLTGAFITGVFATLLATPCAGPFISLALAWCAKQEPVVVFSIWAMLGIGMASPFILFGFFPQGVKLLPKPGMWMVRFKEFSGFALLATVIYIVFIIQNEFNLTILLLIFLLAIAMGTWMIGNFYISTTPLVQKNKIRAIALTLTAIICGLGLFVYDYANNSPELPWQDFSTQSLQENRADNKMILIDFTASWCPNCKVNEAVALNKERTIAFVNEHNIVALKADYTDYSEEIKAWRNKFGSETIPLTVIIPPNKPNTAIVFRALFSEEELINNLKFALELSNKPKAQATAKKQSARE